MPSMRTALPADGSAAGSGTAGDWMVERECSNYTNRSVAPAARSKSP